MNGYTKRNESLTFIEEITSSPIPQKLKKISNTGGEKASIVHPEIAVGAFVKHSIFGIGKVLETSIENGNEKVEIDFAEKGKKSLLLKFAKLEILK